MELPCGLLQMHKAASHGLNERGTNQLHVQCDSKNNINRSDRVSSHPNILLITSGTVDRKFRDSSGLVANVRIIMISCEMDDL